MNNHKTVEDYIASFPSETREKLSLLRFLIKKLVPEAEEKISYQMPTYMLNGPLVYFAGYKKHIGFYPTNSGISAFKDEISHYKWSKGAVQFPLSAPLPVDLIKRIVEFRVKENIAKQKSKNKT